MGSDDGERLTMADVRRLLGRRRNGKLINPATLWRWYHRGLRGVVLHTRLEGGARLTTRGWLEEFFAALKAKRGDGKGSRPEARTPCQRGRSSKAAEKRLQAKAC
jgi:hypothetical protein